VRAAVGISLTVLSHRTALLGHRPDVIEGTANQNASRLLSARPRATVAIKGTHLTLDTAQRVQKALTVGTGVRATLGWRGACLSRRQTSITRRLAEVGRTQVGAAIRVRRTRRGDAVASSGI